MAAAATASAEDCQVSEVAVYHTLERRSKSLSSDLQKTSELLETLGNAAGLAKLYGQEDEYKKVLDAALNLMTKHHEMKLFHDALVYLGSPGNEAYKASLESTDFETLIEETMLVLKNEEGRYSPENDPLMECFNSTVAAIVPTAAQDEVIDDEIQIQGGSSIEKNTKCPFTMKLLIDLDEPVEDAKGFVYEKKPLVDYLRQAKGRRKSPIAETNHIVTVNELKPAKHVLAAQRRRA
eukprot:jgi/Picsp_1/6241/NSC_03595-R1_protein